MGGGDEVAIVDGEIMNRRGRQIELQALPARAVIERNKRTGFGASKQQAFTFGIFTYRANVRTIGNAAVNACPRLARVGGLVDVRCEVVELMTIGCEIRGAGVVR